MIFRVKASVTGQLVSSFAFRDMQEAQRWHREDVPLLEQKFGKLAVKFSDLPGLTVGDNCHVYGEGNEVFEIIKIFEYSKDRPGFVMSNGVTEEVAKCYEVT